MLLKSYGEYKGYKITCMLGRFWSIWKGDRNCLQGDDREYKDVYEVYKYIDNVLEKEEYESKA